MQSVDRYCSADSERVLGGLVLADAPALDEHGRGFVLAADKERLEEWPLRLRTAASLPSR
jgi:hypothetical protein